MESLLSECFLYIVQFQNVGPYAATSWKDFLSFTLNDSWFSVQISEFADSVLYFTGREYF